MARAYTYAAPDGRIGYYTGAAPRYGGTGSMAGPKAAGTLTGAGMRMPSGSSDWHPTVKYLLGLVIGELVLFGVVRYYSRHGG
jgi:hypothetical protein